MKFYQVKIELQGLNVWRRVLVPEDITFYGLKKVIDYSMKWSDYHEYEFEIKGNLAFVDHAEEKNARYTWSRCEYRESRTSKVFDYVKSRQVIKYLYDFGDEWLHKIKIEKAVNGVEGEEFLCLEGEGGCPPEDCGGVGGYLYALEVLSDPEDDEYEHMLDWMGIDDVSELHTGFDIDQVNKYLKGLKHLQEARQKDMSIVK